MVEEVGPIDCEIHAGEIVGLVGLRGAGQESIGRALFGVSPMTGGRILLDGRHVAVSSPREAMARGINLVCADRVGESIMPNLSVRENLFLNPVAAGLNLFSFLSPGRENPRREGARRCRSDCGRTIRRCRSSSCPAATSRRWSSGAGCILTAKIYVFEDPTAGVDVGAKAEIYRLFDVALQAGRGDHHRLDRFRGGRRRSATARWSSIAAGSSPNSPRTICRWKICSRPLPPTYGAPRRLPPPPPVSREEARMQSIKSNALEPTRPELAGLSRWARRSAAGAGLRLAPSDARCLIVLFSILLPDTFPTWLNARSILARQGDRRPARARRDPADDGRPHRPDRRLRHRDVAHSGHQPSGQIRRPMAARDPDRDCLRRARRPHQRRAGRGGAGRRLRRHARHRHDSLRARALAHRRAPDHRRAAARLHRHQHDVDLRHPHTGHLCARPRDRAVDRQRAAADRPLHLRHRRQ